MGDGATGSDGDDMKQPMKVVILAGGLGSRLSEETELRPKPMVEIGGQPILWHIMKHFARYGHTEFFIALGYKGDVIKRWFIERSRSTGNLTVDLATGVTASWDPPDEKWTVHLVETGLETHTGGRLLRLAPHLQGAPFMVTYGDGVSDVDVPALLAFHRAHGKLATVTAVRPAARFGTMEFDGERVTAFKEKPQTVWLNMF